MGLCGMQDVPNLSLLLPLLQDPSRLISVFKLASNAHLSFQTPHAPLAIDAPYENIPMALPTSEGGGGGTGAWNSTACSHGPIPASQGVQGQGAHRHTYHPMRNRNQNQNWSLTILGSYWRLSLGGGLLVTLEHAHAAPHGASQTSTLKGTGTNKLHE